MFGKRDKKDAQVASTTSTTSPVPTKDTEKPLPSTPSLESLSLQDEPSRPSSSSSSAPSDPTVRPPPKKLASYTTPAHNLITSKRLKVLSASCPASVPVLAVAITAVTIADQAAKQYDKHNENGELDDMRREAIKKAGEAGTVVRGRVKAGMEERKKKREAERERKRVLREKKGLEAGEGEVPGLVEKGSDDDDLSDGDSITLVEGACVATVVEKSVDGVRVSETEIAAGVVMLMEDDKEVPMARFAGEEKVPSVIVRETPIAVVEVSRT